MKLLGPDAIGPHSRGVDHVVRPDRELLARGRVGDSHARLLTVLGQQLDHLEAVGHDRAEPLRLAEHRQHQPHVVGLAVVEQIAPGGVTLGERR